MIREEFVEKWNKVSSEDILRIIRVDGGIIYANRMKMIALHAVDNYFSHDMVYFGKDVNGIYVAIGDIRLDRVWEVY